MASDVDNPSGERANIAEYSVSELSFALKRTVEGAYGYVRVRGELGRISRPGSGHIYLDLKDDKAVLAGVIWRGVASRLNIQPEQGLEVIATGKLTTYPGQSKYQIVIDALEPAGLGALMALLEERKKKLGAEGLFDEDRKRPLPYLPRVIGVVTSPSGAVIRDILHRLAERFPTHVIVWPVRVQGETSGAEVAAAINGFNALGPADPVARPDLLIIARGGGSIEDLWGFNEEAVVRAAAAGTIPLISAVGHETDWTLIDLAADKRAPTPTAAAEFAVPERSGLIATVADYARRQTQGLWRRLEQARTSLRAAGRGLPRPADLLSLPRQRFDTATARLPRALLAGVQQQRNRLVGAAARLAGVGPVRYLAQPRARLSAAGERLPRALVTGLALRRAVLQRVTGRLRPSDLSRQIATGRDRLETAARRQHSAMAHNLERLHAGLSGQEKLLASLSYRSVLQRGFALVREAGGAPVRSVGQTRPGLGIEIEFHDGVAGARIESTSKAPAGAKKKRAASKPASGQGSLF